MSPVATYQDGSTVTLTWHQLAPGSVDRVLVSYAQGKDAPMRPADGTRVRTTGPDATTAVLRGLAPHTSYSASVWTRRNLRLSRRRTVHFTTLGRLPSRISEISGVVTDRSGHPLAGVEVAADDFGAGTPLGTVTASDGSFGLQVAAGTHLLVFIGNHATGGNSDATGYVSDYRGARVRPGANLQLDPVLADGAAATGRVVDAAGAPVAGAAVFSDPVMPYVEPDHTNVVVGWVTDESGAATTLADGTFTVTGLPEGAQTLCVDPAQASATDGSGYVGRCGDSSLKPAAGSTTVLPDLPLRSRSKRKTATVHGVVHDSRLFGAAGVIVTLEGTRLGIGRGYAQTTTDENGRYSAVISPGRYRLCVQPMPDDPHTAFGDELTCRKRPLVVAAGTNDLANLTLRAAGAASGIIRTADGAPVVGATVRIGTEYMPFSARTDAHGRYVLTSVPQGRYRVCVSTGRATAAGAAGGVIGGCDGRDRKVQVRSGRLLIGLGMRLHPGGALTGTVTEPGEAETFAGVMIRRAGAPPWAGRAVRTDRSGTFHVAGLTPGRYRACADVFHLMALIDQVFCSSATVQVVTGQQRRLDFAVPSSGRIGVTVSDGAGNPVAGVDAAAFTRCFGRGCDQEPALAPLTAVHVRSSWTTDNDGAVTLNGLRRGNYAVCGFAYSGVTTSVGPPTGYADACTPGGFAIATAPGSGPTVHLVLGLGGEVTGTVTAADGTPLPGVRVLVSGSAAADVTRLIGSKASAPLLAARSDSDGSFAVRSVTPGQQTVCFDATKVITPSAPHGFRPQCFGGAPGDTSGSSVPVTAGDVTNHIDIALTAS